MRSRRSSSSSSSDLLLLLAPETTPMAEWRRGLGLAGGTAGQTSSQTLVQFAPPPISFLHKDRIGPVETCPVFKDQTKPRQVGRVQIVFA
jgi:hypothetical protein